MTDELFTATSTLETTTWTPSCREVEYSAKQIPASHSCEDRLRVALAMVTAPPLPSNSPHPGVAWRSGLDQKAQTGALKLGFEPNRGISQSGPIQGLNLPKPLATRAVHHRSSRPKTMGVTYYTYRYYDPLTGRWPSRDPIEEDGGVNLYGFLGNDGINGFDVLGMQDFDCTPCQDQCDKCFPNPGERQQCEADCRNAKLKMNCGPDNKKKGGDDDDDNGGGGGRGGCISRCIQQSGGNWALGALGLGSIGGGSVPLKAVIRTGVAGGGRSGIWTTVPSMIGTAIGGSRGVLGGLASGLRTLGRAANPAGRIVQAAAGGYAAGVAASCAANCAINPNFF